MKSITAKKAEKIRYAREHTVGVKRGKTIVPILKRDYLNSETEICPFCGSNHIHGSEDGHRLPHCANMPTDFIVGKNVVFKNLKGEIFDQENGYCVVSFMQRCKK